MTIFSRSALVYHGKNPAPDVHSVVIPRFGAAPETVTWSDIMAERCAWQAGILRCKRGAYDPVLRPFRLSVAYFDQFLMGGWQAMLDRVGESIWIDRDRDGVKVPLMRLFPLLLDFSDWREWKVEFAHQFQRRRQDGHPVGIAMVWYDGADQLELR